MKDKKPYIDFFLLLLNISTQLFKASKAYLSRLLSRCNISFTTMKLRWLKHRSVVYHGWFERVLFTRKSSRQLKKTNIYGYLRLIVLFCHEKTTFCLCSLKSPHRGDSNEYTQRITILWRIEETSLNYPHLPPDRALWLTHNYPCLEQISMVPKMFEPLKFDWIWILCFKWNGSSEGETLTRPQGYKTEHEIFSAKQYENANNSWHFHIY